ncbi:Methyltransferase type 11 [Pyrenophora seminiperda CCB06]|uniref:Methyltransferase type 11 n=1 Tax=Pyrenophora seminiperda CCB06 TaxID=1302712 RepID=A0A3M7MCP8_9PLEO|nr:Methyltransferase type 11 [Pyrenophora seminiperda CCB06]
MDDFYLNRLVPVVIRGTGFGSELSRSPEPMQSSSSLDVSINQGLGLKNTVSNTSQSGPEKNPPTLLPSAMPDNMRGSSPIKRIIPGSRKPSESDDDTKRSFLPRTTSKRTSQALQTAQGPSKHSASASRSGKIRKDSTGGVTTETKESSWLKSSKKSKVEKEAPKPAKRWNFFQRAHAGPRAATPAAPVASTENKVVGSRSVAHYALMDQSALELDDIEQLMQEVDEGTESALSDDEPGRRERMQSMLLPPKPVLPPSSALPVRSASPKVSLRPEAQTQPQSQLQSQPQQQSKLSIDTIVQPAHEYTDRYSQADLTPFTDISRPSSLFRAPSPEQDQPTEPERNQDSEPANVESNQGYFDLPQEPASPGPPPVSPPPRPSRLPQVGRIPQVVSTRRQTRGPSSQSFSRPFVSSQPRPAAIPRTSFDSIGSAVATTAPVEPYPILQGLSALAHGSAIATISPMDAELNRRSEFFKFPPRKDSEVSYSSSSGIWSFAPAASTAVVPTPGAPLSEDELWNEYDDLIDEVLSPATSRTNENKQRSVEDKHSLRSHPSLEPMPLRPKAPYNDSRAENDDDEVEHPSLHLRRSRLLAVLHSNQSPTSSVSLSEFISEYGEKKISVIDPVTGRLSLPVSPRFSSGSAAKRSTRSSLPVSLSQSARQSRATVASGSSKDRDSVNTGRYRDTRFMDIAESQTDGLMSMANLRFGALMTSKWLSFGRVLFSPVHFELKDPKEDRVLVIDGLGKDWSYYCALTYPEATVYDMGPDPSSPTAPETVSEPWSTLSNHRHICHPSLGKAFPFPMHFFACVVLRFPTALPSSEHRFVLSEAKRVLRPGGYLEFSVLDMDLVNMGNRARRAVRGLKMRMQVADENISLRNISDEVMAGIGRKGFVECNRCVVGVPVAGKLPSLDDVQASSHKKKGSTASRILTQPRGPKPEVSFSDLLNVSSPSETTDNGITDMVARVGRWWYSRCYESLVLPEAGEPGAAASGTLLQNSIWRDETLVNECEKRGTSFKLLIGYAQKPEVGVRRTVSV